MIFNEMVSLDRARELLSYSPITGLFTWLESRGRVMAGSIAGCVKKDGEYLGIKVDSVDYMAPRLAWLFSTGDWPTGNIYHINGNPLDNRIANLIEVLDGDSLPARVAK